MTMSSQPSQPHQASAKRYTLDCRKHPGSQCSLSISGTQDEVLNEGMHHVTSAHGEKNEPALRDKVRGWMKEEKTYNA